MTTATERRNRESEKVIERGRGMGRDWRWALAAAATAQLLSIMGYRCMISFLPLFVQTIGIPTPAEAAVWTGLASGSQAFAVALFSPFWGSIADRYGTKLMVARALFSSAILFIVLSFVGHVWQLVAIFIVMGCLSGVNTAIITLVSGIAPRDRIGMAVGICQTALFTGTSLGPAVGGVVADTFSYRAGIRTGSALMLVAGFIAVVGIHEPARTAASGKERTGFFSALAIARQSRSLLLLIGLIFTIQAAVQMLTPVLPIFIQQLTPGTRRVATVVGIVLAVGGVTSAIGALVCGRAADKVGKRRILAWTTAGGALITLLQAFVPGVVALTVLRGASGLFTGGLSASTQAAIGALVPAGSRGAAFGISGSAFSLGTSFGPMIGGTLSAVAGPRVVIALSAGFLGIGWLIVRLLGREQEDGAAASERPRATSAEG